MAAWRLSGDWATRPFYHELGDTLTTREECNLNANLRTLETPDEYNLGANLRALETQKRALWTRSTQQHTLANPLGCGHQSPDSRHAATNASTLGACCQKGIGHWSLVGAFRQHLGSLQSPCSRHTVAIQSPYSRHWKNRDI